MPNFLTRRQRMRLHAWLSTTILATSTTSSYCTRRKQTARSICARRMSRLVRMYFIVSSIRSWGGLTNSIRPTTQAKARPCSFLPKKRRRTACTRSRMPMFRIFSNLNLKLGKHMFLLPREIPIRLANCILVRLRQAILWAGMTTGICPQTVLRSISVLSIRLRHRVRTI